MKYKLYFCYNCGVPLTGSDVSEEHIIPNALGGICTSSHLLCLECNNMFGGTIDAEVFNKLAFASNLSVHERDRKKDDVSVKLVNKDGDEHVVGKDFRSKSKASFSVPGKTPVVKWAENDAKAQEFLESKKAQLEQKFGPMNITTSTEPPPTGRFHFTNSDTPGFLEFGGIGYNRGIAKIMLNFILTNEIQVDITRLLYFVKDIWNRCPVFPYHPEVLPCSHAESEFSHLLYLRADPVTGVCICYLELFNAEKYLSIVDTRYRCSFLEKTYCYEVRTGTEIQKVVNIVTVKEELLKATSYSQSQANKDRWQAAIHDLEHRLEKLQLL
jgi:hypothetical protein